LDQDRRYTDRFTVPDGKVIYKLSTGKATAAPIKDITNGGLCFELDEITHIGNQIELEILIPGKTKLILKGNIRWASLGAEEDRGFAGVQFLPFGTDDRYNSMKSHDQLRAVIDYCQQFPQA